MLDPLRFLTISDFAIALIDITVVAYVVYRFFILIKGTRAVQLIKGIIVLLVATSVSQWLQLYTINWLLVNVRTVLLVALPVKEGPHLPMRGHPGSSSRRLGAPPPRDIISTVRRF